MSTESPAPSQLFGLTTRAQRTVYEHQFAPGDWLVFGAETSGLSTEVRAFFQAVNMLRLPMLSGQRSLNLSNAVAITVYEAWRQNSFAGQQPQG